jgi:hypothetical protein
MKKMTVGLAALFAVLVTTAPSAQATLLLPPLGASGTVACGSSLCNTTQNSGGNPIGSLVADTGVQSFTITTVKGVSAAGNAREVVYREDGTNGSTNFGTLDFYIQVQVATGLDFVQEISTGSFAGFVTNVGTANNVSLLGTTGTQDPDSANRSFGSGSTINWQWTTSMPIVPGTTSWTLAISTNAQYVEPGTLSVQDQGTANLNGWEPTTVPEPAGIVLFGTASALTAFFFRRRQTRKA